MCFRVKERFAALLFTLNFCSGFLNIEELSNTKYTLDILSKPLSEVEIIQNEGLKLGSRHGQSYFCKLPEITVSTTEKEEEKIPKTMPIASLLEPMRHEGCLKTAKGWWTYEFCYGKFVKQYHEEGTEKKGETTYLGYYESDFDWNKENLDETYNYKRHKFNRYHSQTYVNGTACDVINHNRDTEIRYLCEDSSTETYIERVDEPSTCSYILTIRTPYICSHPHTRPQRTPKPIDIVCRPILSMEDYAKFKETEKVEREKPIKEEVSGVQSGLNDIQDLFYSQLMKMFDFLSPQKKEDDKKLKKQDPKDVQVAKEKTDEDYEEDRAIKMIERFIVGDRLQNLKAFQQRRLVVDVKDLLRIYKHLPTADQARVVEEYVSKFVGTLEDIVQAEEEALDFEERTIRGLNSQLMDDITNLPLPDSDEEEAQDDEMREKDKKPKPRLSVHVKVHRLKSIEDLNNIKAEDLLSDEEDPKDYDPSWKKLEDDIGQGLEDAGFQTEGDHVEIRLVTNSESLSDSLQLNSEEGERFRQMLMELVGGGTARKNEVKKQKNLHDNYNLVWEKGSSSFRSLGNFDEDSDQDTEVQSPKFKL